MADPLWTDERIEVEIESRASSADYHPSGMISLDDAKVVVQMAVAEYEAALEAHTQRQPKPKMREVRMEDGPIVLDDDDEQRPQAEGQTSIPVADMLTTVVALQRFHDDLDDLTEAQESDSAAAERVRGWVMEWRIRDDLTAHPPTPEGMIPPSEQVTVTELLDLWSFDVEIMRDDIEMHTERVIQLPQVRLLLDAAREDWEKEHAQPQGIPPEIASTLDAALRRCLDEAEDDRAGVMKRTNATDSPRHSDMIRRCHAALAWLEAQPAPQPSALDAPTHEGWWAFEGRWNYQSNAFQTIYELTEYGGELKFSYQYDTYNASDLVGKWWPLQLPWAAQEAGE